MIALQEVSLGYQGHAVLARVDLKITRDDFLVICGPNGSGKSTLLRGLCRLLDPLSGRIERGDARLGYVPQQLSVDQAMSLTALELVGLSASAGQAWWRTLFPARSRWHRELLAQCHAADLAGRSFHVLSGGQRQRVLLAAALATRPDFLVLDEPTAGVDRLTQQSFAAMLGQRHRDHRVGVILVTHEVAPFLEHATRFLEVRQGKVSERQPGDPNLKANEYSL